MKKKPKPRIPVAPSSKRHKTKKDYDRKLNKEEEKTLLRFFIKCLKDGNV